MLGYLFQCNVQDWVPSHWDFIDADGKRLSVKVALNARFNSSSGLRDVALQGQGVAVLPIVRAQDHVTPGASCPCWLAFAPPPCSCMQSIPLPPPAARS